MKKHISLNDTFDIETIYKISFIGNKLRIESLFIGVGNNMLQCL